jgi:DNA-binding ferritin-like protein (Dps family)
MSSKTIYETFSESTEKLHEQFNAFYKSAETGKAVRIFNKTKQTWENLQNEYLNQSIEMTKKAKQQSENINDLLTDFTQGKQGNDQIQNAKKAWNQIINNNKEMIDWLVTNNNKSLDILNNHVSTLFDEMMTPSTQAKTDQAKKNTTKSKK